MRALVVYDNESVKEGMKTGWGFSCLIDDDILFDTGGDGETLLHNLRKLNVEIDHIKAVILSHEHGDHTGGLLDLLEEREELIIYALPSFSKRLEKIVPPTTKLVEVRGPMRIRESVFTTGPLGAYIEEQSLVYLGRKGGIVITGCSHPGLRNILNAASKFGRITGVMGGFHGFDDLGLLKEMDFISPCHCTWRKKKIAQEFPKQYVKCGVGLTVKW